VPDGQPEQIGIGNLMMSDQQSIGYALVKQSDVVWPKYMVLVGDYLAKKINRLDWRHGIVNYFGIG
jgi:hypothetical protein